MFSLENPLNFTLNSLLQAAEEWTKTSPDCDLQQLRIDGGKQEFNKRWGYETLESIKENSVHHSPFGK